MKGKRGLIIISVLCVITLIVVAGWVTLPKLLADNAIVNDIKITSEVHEQQITLSVSDQNQQDTKVMIPLDPNLEYQSTDQQAGVTYDAEEHQLVIDWLAEQSKQVTVQLKANVSGTYQFQAQTVRAGRTVLGNSENATVSLATASTSQSAMQSEPSEQVSIEASSMTAPDVESQQTKATSNSGEIGTCSWYLDDNKTIHIGAGTISNLSSDFKEPWEKLDFNKIILDGKIIVTGRIDYFFASKKIEEIENLKNLDTNQVTSMIGLFQSAQVKKLDLSNFDTSNVTTMRFMFYKCSQLESLNLTSFNTQKVNSMQQMFNEASALKDVDLSSFDTSNVTTMSSMFWKAGVEKLDLSNFDTSNVTDMGTMFYECLQLESLDMTGFNTQKVIDMVRMFAETPALKKIDVSSFDTSNVTDMRDMFQGAGAEKLDLSNFDTSNVTNMGTMFNKCLQLESLDISSFNTKNVTNMNWMFKDTKKLLVLDISNFEMQDNVARDSMFDGTGIHSIALGSKVKLDTTNIPTVSGAQYTGKWVSNAYPTKYTSRDLMNKYDGSTMSGEWHWERADLSTLDAKDSTIYIGDTWRPVDNFVKAIDFDGNNLTVDQIRVQGTVDTETPGSYPVTYSLRNGSKSKTVNVVVKSGALTFTKHPELISFEDSKIATQTQNVQLKPTDLTIGINDGRPKRSAWRLELQLVDNFKDGNGATLETPLIYQAKDTQQEQVLSPGNSISVYDQAANNKDEDYAFDLSAKNRLLMRVLPGTVKVGTYTGDLLWTLTDAPA